MRRQALDYPSTEAKRDAKGARHPWLNQASVRRALIGIDLLFAVGAVAGGALLALYPGGEGPMQFKLEYLRGSPFANYFIPGLFLTGVGSAAIVAAFLHIRHHGAAPHISFLCGALLVVFELVEVTLIPFSALQPVYFVVGLAMVGLATQIEPDHTQVRGVARRAAGFTNLPVALVVFGLLLGLYAVAVHPWFINYGSTAAERTMALPGDDVNPNPAWQTTRAITINASAETVWAWLVQHGQDRAGFYSYDWLENLTGANIHNVDELRPEWQTRAVGESIPLARRDLLGGLMNGVSQIQVRVAEPGRALITGPVPAEQDATSMTSGVASRILIPIDANTTRLIWREREGSSETKGLSRLTGDAFRWLVWDPMHFIMQYGMLRGIEARAEGNLHEPASLYYAAKAGWLLGGFAVAASFALSRRAWRWLPVPILLVMPALAYAGDLNAALAGFIAAGIVTLGFVTWGNRWFGPQILLAAVVFLSLLLSADPYLAIGLVFAILLAVGAAWFVTLGRPLLGGKSSGGIGTVTGGRP